MLMKQFRTAVLKLAVLREPLSTPHSALSLAAAAKVRMQKLSFSR